MRPILILFLFACCRITLAQTVYTSDKSAQQLAQLAKKFDTHSASIKDVPKKFQNESVVILFHSANFFIERGDVIFFVERVKTRVYLKDKAAVEKYSTYYTSGYGDNNSSEVTIIKPDGTSRTLELKDGIKETNSASIPIHYRSSVTLNQTYYKFALPDLEPGDIIDYTQISKNPMGILTGNIPFSRIYLASDFPVVKTFLTIEVPTKDAYMYVESLNGAPQLEKKTGEKGLVTLSLEDSLRDKITNDWKLPREKYVPHIKFIVTRYTGADNNEVIPIRTADNRIHAKFSNDEFTRAINLIPNVSGFGATAAKIVMAEVIAANPEAKTDVNKLIELCWYYVRKKVINEEYIYYSEMYVPRGQYDMYIATIFMQILSKKKQSFDLVLTTGNKNAGIKNVISPMEISWGIRWNGKYMMYPSYYMQFGELPNVYQGAEALIVQNYTVKSKTFMFKPETLPALVYKDNILTEKYTLSITEDFDKITCTRSMTATKGFTGTFIQDYYMRDFNDDQLKYIKVYKATDSTLLYKGLKGAAAAELKRKNNEEQAQYFKNVRDSHIELVKDEYYMMDEYKSYKFNGYAMTPNSPEFAIEESFTLNDLVKKAGNGYMVRIGALLGDYDKVEEDFRKRNYSGTLDLVSSKTATIIFQVPDGYKVSSLDKANKSFSNDFMDMQSSLTIVDNTVVLTITRNIKKGDFTVTEFETMVKYYDEMYELTQQQIVLKKK